MGSRSWLVQFAGFVLATGAAAYLLGSTYVERLGDHGGYDLVGVQDRLGVSRGARPQRSVVVVVDGLGIQEAKELPVLQWLARTGQCHPTQVGNISVSRPMYAVLSTGLEQERTGCRNNANAAPLAAESVWEVAREAGLSVLGVSSVSWWTELFPAGFSRFHLRPEEEDLLAGTPAADLTLLHPVYLDDAGHAAGAASPQYRAAMSRVDGELTQLLASLDLRQDLLMVTADHGHALQGGHGGTQPRVAWVWTCLAGRGVRPGGGDGAPWPATAVAPSLSVLLGVRFPAHMRAGEDGLDAVWSALDPLAFPPGYLGERRAALEHFRGENAAFLAGVVPPGDPPRWSSRYRALQGVQAWRLGAVMAAALALMALAALRRVRGGRPGDAVFGLAWAGSVCLAGYATEVLARGSFDLTAINDREGFLRTVGALSLGVGVLSLVAHLAWRRSPRAMLEDLAVLCSGLLVLNAGHPLVYGWTLDMALPGPELLFFPIYGAILLTTLCALGLAVALWRLLVQRVRGA